MTNSLINIRLITKSAAFQQMRLISIKVDSDLVAVGYLLYAKKCCYLMQKKSLLFTVGHDAILG